MLFIYGIMEYGWMFFQRTAVQEAGRQGCRHGSTLDPNDPQLRSEVTSRTEDALARLQVDCGGRDCDVDVTVVGEAPLARLRCQISVRHTPLINAVPTPERLAAGYLYYFEVQ